MDERIQYLLDLNRRNSELFTAQQHARRLYRIQHPTEIGVLKCMDGRIHLPTLTEMPLGILKPFRSMGGFFDLGWPAFQADLINWIEFAINRGTSCLLLVTYHFASGDPHRGCRGFNYDTDMARQHTAQNTALLNKIFGGQVLYAVQCGIDTDTGSLILHGEQGQVINLASVVPTGFDMISCLTALFPTIPPSVIADFAPHMEGNLRHIEQIRKENRPADEAVHKESVLAVGRGFDWLHEDNLALIVGPYPLNLDDSIVTATNLLFANLESGRINGSKVVLMSCAPFRDYGYAKEMAKRRAQAQAIFALNCVQKCVPEILDRMVTLTAVMDENTRLIEPLFTA